MLWLQLINVSKMGHWQQTMNYMKIIRDNRSPITAYCVETQQVRGPLYLHGLAKSVSRLEYR